MRTIGFVLISLFLAGSTSAVAAQETSLPPTGARIRYAFPDGGKQWTGSVTGRSGDTLYVMRDPEKAADRVVVPHLASLDIQTGSSRRYREGAVRGLVIGGFLGGVAGLGASRCSSSDGFMSDFMCGPQMIGIGLGLGAAAGGALGLLIGALIQTPNWTPVVGISPSGGGGNGSPGQALTLGFHVRTR